MAESIRLLEWQMRIETVLADGRRIVLVSRRRWSGVRASRTAIHEARHAVAGKEDVVKATIVPGPGYAGATWFTRFNAAAAAAPHAHGDNGTDFDVAQIKRAGHSLGAAVSAGRAALSGKEEHVRLVAEVLQKHGTLSGAEIRNILDEVDGGYEVVIQIYGPKAAGTSPRVLTRRAKGKVLTLADLPKENFR